MSDDKELDRLAERLDAAFGATHPRAGFEQELWSRIEHRPRRPSWWARPGAGALAGVAAALVVVFGGGLILLSAGHPGGSATSGAARPNLEGPRAGQAAAPTGAFGALPRPQLPFGGPGPAGVSGSERATLVLPSSAPVFRYAEPSAADLAAFTSAHSAPGFALSVQPTSAAEGLEPSFVLSATAAPASGSGPEAAAAEAAAQRFLAQHQLAAPAPNRVAVAVTPGAATTVLYVQQVNGADLVTTAGVPTGLTVVVQGDQGVSRVTGPLPLAMERADYPLVAPAGDGYTSAALVYVLAFDGRYGYLEPAVLFTGPGRRMVVPAVAPSSLR